MQNDKAFAIYGRGFGNFYWWDDAMKSLEIVVLMSSLPSIQQLKHGQIGQWMCPISLNQVHF